MYLADIYTFRSLAGVPRISVPCGKTSEGLPVGLQIMPAFGEQRVLQLAQPSTRWRRGALDGRRVRTRSGRGFTLSPPEIVARRD